MLTYAMGQGTEQDWIIGEEKFSLEHQGKCESIFALSNGYLGLRSAFEEEYPYQTRGLLAAGCYNQLPGEATELPNAADSCEVTIYLNGELFSMLLGTVHSYQRYLNLFTGELVRNVLWESPGHLHYRLTFRRFVSMKDMHTYGLKVEIHTMDGDADIAVKSGINARITNSGVQHFTDGVKRVTEDHSVYLDQTMEPAGVTLYHCFRTDVRDGEVVKRDYGMDRRRVYETITFQVKRGNTVTWEKLCGLYTSRDLADVEDSCIQAVILDYMRVLWKKGYNKLFAESKEIWKCHWQQYDLKVDAEDRRIQLALRFAQFHLMSMLPLDNRSSIGAKGLTGQGYKGHVFWDTEMFILPYFLYTYPQKARQLLEYRIQRKEQAKKNAEIKGYKGYMFPWESCETGEEETPLFVSMDILTGKAAHVWAGLKEHHITADIAYVFWLYCLSTGDEMFMKEAGDDLLVGCALFWLSRSIFVEEKERYEIRDIIGPDEYTEHIDNNTYTNYLVHDIVGKALRRLRKCSEQKRKELEKYFQITDILAKLEEYYALLYLPAADTEQVIPQDDTFMCKKIIDVIKYRNDDVKQMILKKYSRNEVDDMQVLKQADTVMLLEILPDLFPQEEKRATWNYYEPKTIHDSSLSRAVYAIVACDNGWPDKAYENYQEAIMIDMGQNSQSSDEGIHAAAMGGIWKGMVRGFAGIQVKEEGVWIWPRLAKEIKRVRIPLIIRGQKFYITITHGKIQIESDGSSAFPFIICGDRKEFTGYLEVNYRE